jgi:hypothetical protein
MTKTHKVTSEKAAKVTGAVKRSRKGTNLYLPADLVNWATEYAKTNFKTSRNPRGISLSLMVERRLMRLKRQAEKNAA